MRKLGQQNVITCTEIS